MVASYSGLYEEGEVEHINGVWPVFPLKQLSLQLATPLGVAKSWYKTMLRTIHFGLLISLHFHQLGPWLIPPPHDILCLLRGIL